MSTQIPYNLVLIPSFDEDGLTSVFMAEELSNIIDSKVHETKVFDFDLEFESFFSKSEFSDEEKNPTFFIELFWAKILNPGNVTFIANFDIYNVNFMMSNFRKLKLDIKVLLIYSNRQYKILNLDENVDRCGHNGVITKSMMGLLGFIGESH
jgi:hypothetical protein